jgi:hypothetical protein
MKHEGPDVVPQALTVLARGERYASQTQRFVAAGRALGEIAGALKLSAMTTAAHLEALKDKLRAETARELGQLTDDLLRSPRLST